MTISQEWWPAAALIAIIVVSFIVGNVNSHLKKKREAEQLPNSDERGYRNPYREPLPHLIEKLEPPKEKKIDVDDMLAVLCFIVFVLLIAIVIAATMAEKGGPRPPKPVVKAKLVIAGVVENVQFMPDHYAGRWTFDNLVLTFDNGEIREFKHRDIHVEVIRKGGYIRIVKFPSTYGRNCLYAQREEEPAYLLVAEENYCKGTLPPESMPSDQGKRR